MLEVNDSLHPPVSHHRGEAFAAAPRSAPLSAFSTKVYESVKFPFALAFLVAISLKLAAAYVFLLPLNALYLLANYSRLMERLREAPTTAVPMFIFAAVAFMTSMFGFAPEHSVKSLVPLLFYAVTILMMHDVSRSERSLPLFRALVYGAAVPALITLTHEAFPEVVPRFFLGHLTEAGQKALILIVAFGLGISEARRVSTLREHVSFKKESWIGLVNFLLFCFVGFSNSLIPSIYSASLELSLLAVAALSTASCFYRSSSHRSRDELWLALLFVLIIPLLGASFLVNLKRGPWAGAVVGSIILFLFYERRYIIPFLLSLLLLAVTVSPVRTRIYQSAEHFFIYGGRSVIWEVGMELAPKYPLGVGYKNSLILRNFSSQIPPELRHFHNNFLNVLVETGWMGLGVYLWWLAVMFRAAFNSSVRVKNQVMASAIGCALLSWQVAGVVEYNFGDSEILLIGLALMGLLSSLTANSCRSNPDVLKGNHAGAAEDTEDAEGSSARSIR